MRDADIVRNLADHTRNTELVEERLNRNVAGQWKMPTQAEFWEQLVLAILSSQQASTPGSRWDAFSKVVPFPLALDSYRTMSDLQVQRVIKDAGLRMPTRRADWIRRNFILLFGPEDDWKSLEPELQRLLDQRNTMPVSKHKTLERAVAGYLDEKLMGVGPKQARNVLQAVGLTRYEIPLDSRVVNWLAENLHWYIHQDDLNDASAYEFWLDRLQSVCYAAGVLPAVFDAAAFETGSETRAKNNRTTCIGYVNRNGQVVIRNTYLPGTDHLQTIYQLGCSACGDSYGANGSDIFQRKCPTCQAGAAGLEYANK
jgi:hypothetical protein